MRYIKILLF